MTNEEKEADPIDPEEIQCAVAATSPSLIGPILRGGIA